MILDQLITELMNIRDQYTNNGDLPVYVANYDYGGIMLSSVKIEKPKPPNYTTEQANFKAVVLHTVV